MRRSPLPLGHRPHLLLVILASFAAPACQSGKVAATEQRGEDVGAKPVEADEPGDTDASAWSDEADPAFAPSPGDRPLPSTDWAHEDLIGRVKSVVTENEARGGGSSTATLRFNRFGQRIGDEATLDEAGRVVHFVRATQTTENLEFDDEGRVVRYRETLPHHRGGPDKVTEYRLTYDEHGKLSRRERYVGPTIEATVYEYDDDGDLVSKTFSGKTTRWETEFDGPRKRLTQIPGAHIVEVIDRKSGRTLSIERNGSTTAWTYLEFDGRGNWTSREQHVDGATLRQSRTITYYDADADADAAR